MHHTQKPFDINRWIETALIQRGALPPLSSPDDALVVLDELWTVRNTQHLIMTYRTHSSPHNTVLPLLGLGLRRISHRGEWIIPLLRRQEQPPPTFREACHQARQTPDSVDPERSRVAPRAVGGFADVFCGTTHRKVKVAVKRLRSSIMMTGSRLENMKKVRSSSALILFIILFMFMMGVVVVVSSALLSHSLSTVNLYFGRAWFTKMSYRF